MPVLNILTPIDIFELFALFSSQSSVDPALFLHLRDVSSKLLHQVRSFPLNFTIVRRGELAVSANRNPLLLAGEQRTGTQAAPTSAPVLLLAAATAMQTICQRFWSFHTERTQTHQVPAPLHLARSWWRQVWLCRTVDRVN